MDVFKKLTIVFQIEFQRGLLREVQRKVQMVFPGECVTIQREHNLHAYIYIYGEGERTGK